MKIDIKEARSLEEIQQVFQIRIEVFVNEQKCLPSEEFDNLDAVARHYLLSVDGEPAATGRFRKTEKGIKIERIATMSPSVKFIIIFLLSEPFAKNAATRGTKIDTRRR